MNVTQSPISPSFSRNPKRRAFDDWRCWQLIGTLLWCFFSSNAHAQTNYLRLRSFGIPERVNNTPYASVIEASDGKLYGTTFFGGGSNVGTVFRLNRDGSSYIVLRSFSSNDGDAQLPYAALLEGSDGSLYGTTEWGGSSGVGAVFKLNKDGSGFGLLRSFTGISGDGRDPQGALVEGTDGALYGTTFGFGSSDLGTVFKLNKDGSGYAVLKNFTGTGGASPGSHPRNIAKGSDGALYGTTVAGGSDNRGTVFKLNQDGSGFTVLRHFLGTGGDARNPQMGVMEGSDGVLYGTANFGGTSGVGALFKLNRDGTGYAVLRNFATTGTGGQNPWPRLIEGSDGALYGATASGGISGVGTIFKVNKDGASYTVLRNFTAPNSVGGANQQVALLEGSDGTLYGTTSAGGISGLGTVYQLHKDGIGFGTLWSFSNTGGGADSPQGLIEGSDGALYGSSGGGDDNAGTILQLNKDGTGYTLLRSFSASNGDGQGPAGRLIEGSDGSLYGTTQGGGADGRGTVFKLNKDGTGYSLLRSFSLTGGDGNSPYAGLVEGSDGALYGMTHDGGSSLYYGTVFKLNKDGSGYAVLLSFGTSGANPFAGLIEGTDGALYGTTYFSASGGIGGGTVFKLNKDGSGYVVIRSFGGGIGGAGLTGSVVEGSDGVLYGTTSGGGIGGLGTVFRLNKDGSGFAVLRSFTGTGGDGKLPNSLMERSDGALYGTTGYDGISANGTVFKLNKDGSGYEVLRNYTGTGGDGMNPSGGLLEGSDGALYGTTSYGGDMGLGTVFKLGFGPSVTGQPQSRTNAIGSAANFSVTATGTSPLSYQWRHDGTNIIGAAAPNYVIANVQITDAGDYTVIVTNFAGSVTSVVAVLVVESNNAPIVANPIPDQTNILGSALSFMVAANTFTDPDPEDALSYVANGQPPGVTFDGPTRTFSGTPTATGVFVVTVTATDDGTPPLSVNDVFDLTVLRAPITVTNLADSGAGTLRQAIADAVPGDTINFEVNGTIFLFEHLELDKSITVAGPGATNLVIRGYGSRLFNVTAGPTVISGLTLSFGWDLYEAQPGGGAILNTAHLTLKSCELTHNESFSRGGAVMNLGGSATLIAEGCTFSDDSMSGGYGDGGGAIWSDNVLRITNCTFWNNYSSGNGGAVDTSGDAVIASSTIVGNRADYSSGGGIFNGSGTLALQNSILSGNLIFYGFYSEEVGGNIASGDYNLIHYTNGLVVPGTHNVLGQDPILSPLTYLGGPTRTFGLASISPAVDAGDGATSPAADQRGVPRPQGGGYDIGAFEGALSPNTRPSLDNPIPDQFTTYQAAFNYTIPANTFSDPDAGQNLTYSYSLGYPPPDLIFNPATRTFSGIFRTAGTNEVVVTVTDDGAPPLSTNVTFNIIAPKLMITARADDVSRVIGQFNPSFTVTYYGLAPGEGPFVINNPPSATTTATEASPLGTYPIVLSGGLDDVYEFVGWTNGTLTVTLNPLRAEAANASRGVGQTNQTLLGLLTGVLYPDNITATYTSAATPASPAGDYPITPVLHDPDGRLTNYDVTLVNGTLTVESDAVNPYFQVLHTFGFTNRIGGITCELIEGSDGWLYGTGGGLNGMGVFKIQKDGTGFIVVRTFTPADGAPAGPLLEDANGLLYGGGGSVWSMNRDGSGFTVLHPGGASGLLKGSNGLLYGIGGEGAAGTVFQLNMDGSDYTVLYTFAASYLEGLNQSQLIEGTNGMLYGTASSGGPGGYYGDGTIFSLNKDGSNFSVLHSFTFGATDGALPKARLLQGSDGRLYGTTEFGGPGYGGVVFSLNQDGSGYALVKTFDYYNPIEGINPTAPLIESDGLLYGTTTYYGPSSYGGTAFKMNKDGSGFSVIRQFGPTPDLYEPQYGVLLASDGALYGATSRGGTSDLLFGGGVFKLNKDGSNYQLLYSFSLSGEDGRQPVGVREASDGLIYGTTKNGGTADGGTVFRMNKDGSVYDVLHSFTGSPDDGRVPVGEVMEAGDGLIYGTTSGGGTNGAGTVFRMMKDGSGYAILHDFTGDLSDGSGPSGGLTEGTNGKLYGTTINGGSNYGGTIFSMNKDGSGYSLVHEFDYAFDSPDGSYPRSTMVMDANGVLYGTTSGGGGPGNVFRLNVDGTGFAVLHDFNFAAGDPVNPSGLLLASDGALYGTGNNGVFKLNRDGTDFQVLHSFGPSQVYSLDASYPDAALAEGADGRIYGTTVFGGIDNSGTIFRLNKDGTSYSVLHRFAPPSAGSTSGPNKPAFFRASDGSLYATTGSDLNFGTVYRLNFSVNAAPILDNPIVDQNGTYGSPFSFTFAANTFADPDVGQALNYTAAGLPPGITLNNPLRSFSGTPTNIGTYAVTVMVTDNGIPPLSTNNNFNIVVARAPLTISANDTNRPYGEANPAFTGTLVGVTNSDDLTAAFTTTATPSSPPGDYPITPILQDPNSRLGNYTITTNNGTLSVNGVALEFGGSAGSRTFCWQTNAAAFLLEYTDSLTPPVTWQSVTSGITTNDPNICLTVTPELDVASRFYRLRLP